MEQGGRFPRGPLSHRALRGAEHSECGVSLGGSKSFQISHYHLLFVIYYLSFETGVGIMCYERVKKNWMDGLMSVAALKDAYRAGIITREQYREIRALPQRGTA